MTKALISEANVGTPINLKQAILVLCFLCINVCKDSRSTGRGDNFLSCTLFQTIAAMTVVTSTLKIFQPKFCFLMQNLETSLRIKKKKNINLFKCTICWRTEVTSDQELNRWKNLSEWPLQYKPLGWMCGRTKMTTQGSRSEQMNFILQTWLDFEKDGESKTKR